MVITEEQIQQFIETSIVKEVAIYRLGNEPLILSVGDLIACCLDNRDMIYERDEDGEIDEDAEPVWYEGHICGIEPAKRAGIDGEPSYILTIMRKAGHDPYGINGLWLAEVVGDNHTHYSSNYDCIEIVKKRSKQLDWDE